MLRFWLGLYLSLCVTTALAGAVIGSVNGMF